MIRRTDCQYARDTLLRALTSGKWRAARCGGVNNKGRPMIQWPDPPPVAPEMQRRVAARTVTREVQECSATRFQLSTFDFELCSSMKRV